MPNSYDLKRKTILLTGANGQIGRGLVLALLKNGAEEAGYITGQNIAVDGGFTAW